MQFEKDFFLHQAAHGLTMEFLRNVRFPALEQQGIDPHTTEANYAQHYANIYKEMVTALKKVQ